MSNTSPYAKDGFHEYVINNKQDAVNPDRAGTKFALHYIIEVGANNSCVINLRLSSEEERPDEPFGREFDKLFLVRLAEADDLYYKDGVIHPTLTNEEKLVARVRLMPGCSRANSFIHYVVPDWLVR